MTKNNLMAIKMMLSKYGKRERIEYLYARIARLKRDVQMANGETVYINSQPVGVIYTDFDVKNAFYEAVDICDALGKLNHLCLRLTGATLFNRRFDYKKVVKDVDDLLNSEAFRMMEEMLCLIQEGEKNGYEQKVC